jgi:tripartite-type tricarboxylate transporter receptor subunit TctC
MRIHASRRKAARPQAVDERAQGRLILNPSARANNCLRAIWASRAEIVKPACARSLVAMLALGTLAPLLAGAAAAERYPVRPIRIVVPSAPGGGPDAFARLIGAALTEAWGQQTVADNRAGAAGNIGAEIAARAPADGYTMLVASLQQVVTTLLFRHPPFDLLRDFAPVCWAISTPFALVVTPSVPAKSVKDLIVIAKAAPGKLNYGSSGTGGTLHLLMEMFRNMANVDVVHVPYKSASYMHVDLVVGQVQVAISALPAILPLSRQGKLKALGVTSGKRTPFAPDLEAIAETLPSYEMVGWYGFLVPLKTPQHLVDALNAQIVQAVQASDTRDKLLALGMEPVGSTPAAFASLIERQAEALRRTIAASGIKPE